MEDPTAALERMVEIYGSPDWDRMQRYIDILDLIREWRESVSL